MYKVVGAYSIMFYCRSLGGVTGPSRLRGGMLCDLVVAVVALIAVSYTHLTLPTNREV